MDNPMTSEFFPNSRSVAFNQIRIKSKFWQSRIRASREGALPVMWERMKETGRWDVLKLGWKEGMPNRPHHFWDSDVAKWTEAACYALTPPHESFRASDSPCLEKSKEDPNIDSFLKLKIAEAVGLISGAQWEDGYINSYFTVVEPGKRWTNVAWYHELYCAGHLLEAAIAHSIYSASSASSDTKANGLLDPLIRYVAHINKVFGPDIENGQKRGYPGHQELELAFLRLYEHLDTKSQPNQDISFAPFADGADTQGRVLSLVTFFIKERGRLRDGVHFYDYEAELRNNDPPAKPGPSYPTAPRWCYNQADAPISQIQSVEGHSVRAGYWLTAVAHLARLTKDEGLLQDARRLWDNMTERKMHITGGLGAIGDWEGFGPDYYFPNESAYAETCASVALIFFAHQMLLIDPMDVRFGDVLETALYNGALVGMSLDGKTFFYENPLATVGKWRERNSWFEVSCCPPNLVRLITSLGKYIYTQSTYGGRDTIHVHLLIDSEVCLTMQNGKEVRLVQETTAPWGGHASIRLYGTCAPQTNVVVRLPNWAHPGEVQITTTGYTSTTPKTRILCFTPESGTQTYQINIDIPVKPRLIYPHPLDTENHASVAVARGPFIYSVETVDNPVDDIDDLRQLRIPDGVQFNEIQIDFPGNTFVGLKGTVSAVIIPTQEAYSDDLREGWVGDEGIAAEEPERPVDVILIPFFAWANRGRSDVRVWLLRSAQPGR